MVLCLVKNISCMFKDAVDLLLLKEKLVLSSSLFVEYWSLWDEECIVVWKSLW